MKMQKFASIILFLTLNTLTHAQRIIGHIADGQSSEPLSYASIMHMNAGDSSILGFALSDTKGYFEIQDTFTGSDYLKVALLGYETAQVSLEGQLPPDTIFLFPADNALETVVVKAYKQGFIVNGDTTKYDVSVYKNEQERDVSDLLKKIPGIEIDESGKVSVGNEPVDEILVEGDNFLNANRKALLNGISANDIESVEVIRNYLSPDDPTSKKGLALNLKLTDEAKSKTQYNIQTGAGFEDKYMARANIQRVKQKLKLNIHAFSNNTGQEKISPIDYFLMNGGRNNEGFRPPIPKLFVLNNDFNNLRTHYASSSISYKPNKKWQFKTQLLGYLVDGNQFTQREELPQGQDIRNLFDNRQSDRFGYASANSTLTFVPNKRFHWKLTSFFSTQADDSSNEVKASLSGNLQNSLFNTNQNLQNSFHQLQGRFKIDSLSSIVSGISYLQAPYDNQIQLTNDSTLTYAFEGNTLSGQQFHQDFLNKQVQWTALLRYEKEFKKISNMYGHIQVQHRSIDYNLEHQGTRLANTQSGLQNLKQYFSELEANLTYLMQKWDLEASLNLLRASFPDSETDIQLTRLYPSFTVNYSPHLKYKIKFSYNATFDPTEIPLPMNIFQLQSINRLFSFDTPASTLLNQHSFRLQFQSFNPLHNRVFLLFSNFQTGQRIGERNFYFPTYTIQESAILPSEQNWITGLFIGSRLNKSKIISKIGLFYLNQKQFAFIGANQQEYLMDRGKLNIGVYSTRKEKSNFDIAFRMDYGRFGIPSNRIRSALLDLKLIYLSKEMKGWFWKTGIQPIWEWRGNRKNDYLNLFGALEYRLKNPKGMTLFMEANDVLNFNNPIRISNALVGNDLINTRTFTLPGFLLIGLRYNN